MSDKVNFMPDMGNSMSDKMNAILDFDLAIIGGGVVGLCLGRLAAAQGLSVAIVEQKTVKPAEKKTAPENKSDAADHCERHYDNRTFALSHASKEMLTTIGIWEKIQTKVCPYQTMKVWEGEGFGNIEFNASEVHAEHLGYIVEHQVLWDALWESAVSTPLIQIFSDKPQNIYYANETKTDNPGIVLQLEKGTTLKAKLLVGAEGANSWLRQALNVEIEETRYEQTAIVATVETQHSHEHTAWQRFLPEGPIAFLPMNPSNVSSVIWTRLEENAKASLLQTKAELAEAFAKALDYKLGSVRIITDVQSFPLKKMHAKYYTAKRIALVGDAIHVIHPMVGQGLNIGIADIVCLNQLIKAAALRNCDIGNNVLLKKYQRVRRSQVMPLLLGIDCLKTWFEQKTTIFGLRSMAVNVVNNTSWVKKFFIREAMGL